MFKCTVDVNSGCMNTDLGRDTFCGDWNAEMLLDPYVSTNAILFLTGQN
jgi:hypothetical protein